MRAGESESGQCKPSGRERAKTACCPAVLVSSVSFLVFFVACSCFCCNIIAFFDFLVVLPPNAFSGAHVTMRVRPNTPKS